MAVNKNNNPNTKPEKNFDISENKTNIESPFEDNFTEVNTKSIKIAQALNNDEINSIQSDANLDLLEPSEVDSINVGGPLETDLLEEVTPLPTEQTISPDFFEGNSNNGFPEEITLNNADEVIDFSDISISPEESLLDGSPLQGQEQSESIADINQNNDVIEPQETNNLEESSPQEIALPNSQIESPVNQEVDIQILPPEEVILNSQPEEGLTEIVSTVTDNNNNLGPIATETSGSPNETVALLNQNTNSDNLDSILTISPSLAQSSGNPEENFLDVSEFEVATNNIAPTEALSNGSPIELEGDSNNFINTENELIETAQLLPQQEDEGGVPQQGFSENNTLERLEVAEVTPEQSQSEGVPQEDTVDEEEPIEIAQIEELEPQEGNTQDYIDTVLENKLSEGIEKGLSPQEAAVLAIEAGRDAIKEAASSPEEIKEYAENLSETLINQINDKIENIETDIKELKEKK